MALTLSIRDTGLTMKQVDVLERSQDGQYKPFITAELNRALSNIMKSTENITKMASILNPNNYKGIFIDKDKDDQSRHPNKGFGVMDALKLLDSDITDYQELQQNYITSDLPNIDARIVGKGDNINLKKRVQLTALPPNSTSLNDMDPEDPIIEPE